MVENVHTARLIKVLKEIGGRYREEPITLATGEQTHVYLDVKGVLTTGERMVLAARAMVTHLASLNFPERDLATAIGGPTMGADVLSHSIVTLSGLTGHGLTWFSVRDKVKTDHGMGKRIEGDEIGPGHEVIITDDVANSGKSLVEAVGFVRETGAEVLVVAPLVDRSDQTEAKMLELDVLYRPLLTSKDLDLEPLKAMR